MECQSSTKKRKSLRLKNFDYASAGAYFITLCTQGRACLFGSVAGGEMRLSEVGEMISTIWSEIPAYYPSFNLDEFVVMPNHFHAIIWKQEQPVGVGPRTYPSEAHATCEASAQAGQPQGVAPTVNLSITDIVHRFKTLTTTRYIKGAKTQNWKPFTSVYGNEIITSVLFVMTMN